MVYPTLIELVSDESPGEHRATAIGVYRFVRDFGYVGGALIGGVLADRVGLDAAIGSGIVFVLFASAFIALSRSAVSNTVPSAQSEHGSGDAS